MSFMPAISETSSEPHSSAAPPAIRQRLVYEFANFRLDPDNRQLCCDRKDVPLTGRAFDALLLLVSRPGELITKEEMLTTVWQGSFVEDANLTVAISAIRRALNEDPHDRRYIQTVARRGYRFIANVRQYEVATKPQALREQAVASLPVVERPFAPISIGATEKTVSSGYSQRWAVVLFVAFALGTLGLASWHFLKPRSPIQSLAVLPLTLDRSSHAASAPSSDEIVLLGLTDGLISSLQSRLAVRPTSSVLRYSVGDAVDPIAAGREQGVDAVLSGVLKTSANSATLHLRLIRIRDGLVLWQDSFQGAPSNFRQLEQIAAQAADKELQRLGAISAPATRPVTAHTNDQAYQLYLRGRYFWNRRTVDGLGKASDYFKQAIDADPNYAPAYAGLADSYALMASFSVEPGSAANADARSAALSAIQLDPTLAEPHASLGMIYFFTDWNLLAAQREFERSIQLNPNYATAHHWYALDLAAMGRFPQALYEIHVAQKLDPLSLIIGTNVGWIEYLSHDNAAAIVALNKVLELDPSFARARTRLGMVQMAMGNNSAAVASLSAVIASEASDPDPYVEGLLGDAEARAGNRAAAERILRQLQADRAVRYVPPISRALVLCGLDRRTEAIAALSEAVDDHSTSMVYGRVDPSLDLLRSDQGFQALLTRMKLSPAKQ